MKGVENLILYNSIFLSPSGGVHDETQINAAIKSLGGNGGRITLLAGIFYISAPIEYAATGTPDSNIILQGQGDSTLLKVPDGHDTAMKMIHAGIEEGGFTPTVDNLVFKDFRIYDNSANVTGTSYNGIMLWSVKGVIIENVTIETSPANTPYACGGYGIISLNSSDVLITNCTFNEWEINGLEVRTTSRIVVTNSHFNNSRFEIYSNCTDFKICNNVFNDTICSWGTDDSVNVINGLDITGNIFRDCKAKIYCSENVLASGNRFSGTASGLFFMQSVKDILVVGNYFDSMVGLQIDGENGFVTGNKFNVRLNYNLCISSLASNAPNKWIIQNNTFDMHGEAVSTSGIKLVTGTEMFIYNNFFRGLYAGINIEATVTSITNSGNIYTNVDNNIIDERV